MKQTSDRAASVGVQPAAVAIGDLNQRRASRADRGGTRTRLPSGNLRIGGRSYWSFLEDDVRVGAGESERADAAMRGRSPRCHRVASVTTTGSRSHGMCGDGVCADAAAATRARSDGTTLMTAMPAAASRCPILVLAEPISSGRSAGRSDPYARARGLGLDGIAERRAGAVRPRYSTSGGRQTRSLQGIGDNPLLCNAIGHGQSAGGAVPG